MSQKDISINSMSAAGQHSRIGQLQVFVCPTTGGSLEVCVPFTETVQGLKNAVSRKLKIPSEKIHLLYKNKTLDGGSLLDYNIVNGSCVTLLPNMESGMTFQRPEAGVMQALENLSDSQVNDFLSGRAPLYLAMRLGDHMMFVQLQLTTSQCNARQVRSPALSTPHTSHLSPGISAFNSLSLHQAGRSLSQRLRDLTRVSTSKVKEHTPSQVSVNSKAPSSPTSPAPPCSPPLPGAVIDSIQNLGQGIYSGTFSGTLDPTLQDREGKPKRDVTTILHILNDLLGAAPKYQHYHHHHRHHHHHHHHCVHHHHQPQTAASAQQSKTVGSNTGQLQEDYALRGKVRQLQMMMEQRRLRRKARREMKAPYQWSEKRNNHNVAAFSAQSYQQASTATATQGTHEHANMDLAENMETSNYRKPTMEQETVAV